VEEVGIFLAGLLVFGLVVGIPILLLVVFARTSNISELAARLDRLEATVRQLTSLAARTAPAEAGPGSPSLEPTAARAPAMVAAQAPVIAAPGFIVGAPTIPAAPLAKSAASTTASGEALSWELFIGRKALGWMAVVVLLFATAFFLRYAFENGWVGPIGRVSMGVASGIALLVAGSRQLSAGWRNFAQMLFAAGVVLLYLATYSAFGFYHLLPQREAGVFLFLIVALSMLLALRCEAWPIALMAAIGGLLTPLLMQSDHDQYVSLFLYLLVLNAGVVGVLVLRDWPAVGSVLLAGTQGVFWLWHAANWHPEKLDWALGFQAVLGAMYFAQPLVVSLRGRRASSEALVRFVLNASLWFGAVTALLWYDHHAWLAPLAVVLATLYCLAARVLLSARARDERLITGCLAIAAGLVALAIPLQAGAPWTALGWAAEAALLWWFGLRVDSGPLRAMSGVLAIVVAFSMFDVPHFTTDSAPLLFNRDTLPDLLAIGCLAGALVATRSLTARVGPEERVAVGVAAVGCVLLTWWITSADVHRYFSTHWRGADDALGGYPLAQMAVSAWWALYAGLVLAMGFRARLSLLRWTALALFAITLTKVFIYDMADLDEIYRIVAFFVLAVLLGISAWAYQRYQIDRSPIQPAQE
jgi:uncharacterized membrane protein